MVLDLHCISFIVYHLLSGNLVIYFINIIISIITITLYYYNYYHYYHIYIFYTYVTLLGAINLTLCIFGGIHRRTGRCGALAIAIWAAWFWAAQGWLLTKKKEERKGQKGHFVLGRPGPVTHKEERGKKRAKGPL